MLTPFLKALNDLSVENPLELVMNDALNPQFQSVSLYYRFLFLSFFNCLIVIS